MAAASSRICDAPAFASDLRAMTSVHPARMTTRQATNQPSPASVPTDATDPSLGERFNQISDWLTRVLGSFPALAGSILLVVVWALTGPIFNFSDTWQLFINTSTTVITFWMVFVIQNSANRSAKATQLKLDEIIRVLEGARDDFISLDKATEQVLADHEKEFDDLVASEQADAAAEQADAAADHADAAADHADAAAEHAEASVAAGSSEPKNEPAG